MTKSTAKNDANAHASEPMSAGSEPPELSRQQQAMALVNSYVPWSIGAGLVPIAGVDMLALTALELRMLAKLSEVYGVTFRENGVKSIVASLLATVISTNLGASLGSFLKFVPVIGPVAGIAATPGLYSAATYAIGRVFVTHFEAGGTFLDFDPQKMRAHFVSEFQRAGGQPEPQKTA
jgi:uncharacterized protein (DUF697 family)